MFQVDQKRGEELKGVKVKRKQPSYWGAIEELLRSCKNCCGIISEWVSETNYKIGEATLGSPFVHVFLRSENPSLGIRDTLKRWSSLLNTRLCIPRVSGSSPPSSTNTIMFIIVIFTCFRCWQESEATFWLNSNPVHRQIDWQADSCCLLTASQKRRGFRFQILYDIRTIRYDEREPGIEPFWNLSIMAMGNFREFWKNIL